MTEGTLEAAREQFKAAVAEGTRCPCCERYAQLYRRRINRSMAVVLRLLALRPEGEWVQVQDLMSVFRLPPAIAASGDYAKLRYWGLIERKPGLRDDTSKRIGFWRITQAGRDFVDGFLTVHEYVWEWDGSARVDEDSPLVTFSDVAAKSGFNFAELMGVQQDV